MTFNRYKLETFPLQKLLFQVTSLQRKLDDLTSDHAATEAENQKLNKNIETLKSTARRVEQLEKENVELEGGQHKVERENKALNKEVAR